MSSTSHHRHIRRALTPTAVALALIGVVVTPAAARQDVGEPLTNIGQGEPCSLQRVGTQFVRCDDLTGNDVPAPAFIPQL